MTFNTKSRPQMRAIPCNVPAVATVKVYRTEFFDRKRGETREQWQASYRPEGARDLRDLVRVVVNFYLEDEPQDGDVWEVRMISRAPVAEIVFANALRKVESATPTSTETADEPQISEDDAEHQQAKHTVCAWMATLLEKLATLREHFRR